jgi:hypothetical protein
MNKTDAFLTLTSLIVMAIFISFAMSYPAMLLWNHFLVPAIPAIHEVGWLQMFSIQVLFALIFPRTTVSRSSK